MTNLKKFSPENLNNSEADLNNRNSRGEKKDEKVSNVVFVNGVCAILIFILQQTPRISSDALKRHYAFLVDMCKQYREILNEDRLSCEIMKVIKPFHNAYDKSIRLAVVTTIEVVLKTVDQSNSSDERQDLYQ